MKLSIITVNTNDKEKLLPQIESVKKGVGDLEFEYFLSDNGSTDDSLERVQEKFPFVHIIENGKNLGFGAANNVAAKEAKGEFILFLNPDMRVEKDSLPKIVEWMEKHEDVGLTSVKLVDEEGNIAENAKPRRFPKLFDQFMILSKLAKVFPKSLDSYLYKGFDADKEQEVDSVRGAFMLVKREVVETLGWAFDPRYFIWFEDVDTCREVKKMGLKVMHTPVISCVDYIGQTFKRLPNYQKQVWFSTSMIKYFRKWEKPHTWIILGIVRPFALLSVKLLEIFTKKNDI